MSDYYKENANPIKTSNNPLYSPEIITDISTGTQYEKRKKLGSGGFGEVYEVYDLKNNISRAAKIIPKLKIERDAQSAAAYRNEIKFNYSLDFKYLCKCHSIFDDQQNAYLILDYYPNKTLKELLDKRITLSEIEVKHYGFQLLLAIEYLHSKNILHRDLKLANILLSDKLEVKLCDFGLAIYNESEKHNNVCGTPNYIAPELLKNRKHDLNYSFEIDIWAFGVILYCLFFNKTPFEEKGKTKDNILNIKYTFPYNINHISREAENLIRKIFVHHPAKRPTIQQIKSSSFFANGEGIPKYLPSSTLNKPLTDEQIDNFIHDAIINDECLDKETDLVNKMTSYSGGPIYRTGTFDPLSANYNNQNYFGKFNDDNEDSDSDNIQKKNSNDNNNQIKIKTNYEKSKLENDNIRENENKNFCFASSKKDNNTSKSYGKMNETGGFIVASFSNNDSSYSANFSPVSRKKSNSQVALENNTNYNRMDGNSKYKRSSKIQKSKSIISIIPKEEISNKNIIVEKFIDMSDKCGIGYILSNGDVGTFFNDFTKVIKIKCTINFIYIDNNENQNLIKSAKNITKDCEQKIKFTVMLNKMFIRNKKERSSYDLNPKINKKNVDVYVKKWAKSSHANFFLLSNNNIQVIFNDKTQVIFNLNEKTVTFINMSKQICTESMTLTKYENKEMTKKVLYAKKTVLKL